MVGRWPPRASLSSCASAASGAATSAWPWTPSSAIAPPGAGARAPFELRHHSVPRDLGRNRQRAEAFWRAWSRWLGPSELIFTQRSARGRRAAAQASAEASAWEALQREVWT